MGKIAPSVIVSLLLFTSAHADNKPFDEGDKSSLELAEYAEQYMLEAEALSLRNCNTSRFIVKPKPFVTAFGAIQWTGGCVEGKRDGEGELILTVEMTRSSVNRTGRSTGRMVKGQRLGLWCGQTKNNDQIETEGCQVLAGHGNPLDPETYRKQPDGSWSPVHADSTARPLPPGALEKQSDRILAEAAAGKVPAKSGRLVHFAMLDGLMSGSKAGLAPAFEQIRLKGKRVALVLSSKTISEFERYKQEREGFIKASAGMTGEAAAYRARFIQSSELSLLLDELSKVVLGQAAAVEMVDDLGGVTRGRFDYALLIDWSYRARFDLLGRYGDVPAGQPRFYFVEGVPKPAGQPTMSTSAPSVVACHSIGGLLLTSELKVMNYIYRSTACYEKTLNSSSAADDDGYMRVLAEFFQGGSWVGLAHSLENGIK